MNKPDNTEKIGQGMIYLAWILFLGLLTFGFNQFLQQQNNPNQEISSQWNNEVAEVVLRRNRNGHYLVNGYINRSPVTFLIDTGATFIIIPEVIANKLNLEKGFPTQSITANGEITVFSTRLESVRIGAIELNNVRASINPYMNGKEILLGMSFMQHLEMIQKGNELILRY